MDKKTVDTYCISYNNLWKTLIDNGLKKKDLMSLADVSSATMAKEGRPFAILRARDSTLRSYTTNTFFSIFQDEDSAKI